jgi:hypothetical protein
MSTYASLYVKGQEIMGFRNEVNPNLLYLFLPSELDHLKGKEALEARYGTDEDPEDYELDEVEAYIFCTSAGTLKKRLSILGINSKSVEEVWKNLHDNEIEELESGVYAYDAASRKWNSERANERKQINFQEWRSTLKQYLDGKIDRSEEQRGYVYAPVGEFEYADERVILRAIIDFLDDDEPVFLDVSEMADEGWTKEDIILETEPAEYTYTLPSEPPIILTEGVFDLKVLDESIQVLHPELAAYFKFIDTEYKTEGGAASVVKQLKSFAAAGISNRIIAVFDNDTAAREALSSLKGFKLPTHFTVMHYPDLELLEDYPTLGPLGAAEMNVNGLAGSIEMYLGRDVLYQDDQTFKPIQWTGYIQKMKAYQGEVIDKSEIQKLFLTKLKLAKADTTLLKSQDWSGLEAIINSIIIELGSL